jgi:hypothetical protein
MIMKWINEKAIWLTSITHEDKMVPTGVRVQDIEKRKVVMGYNSGMGGVNPSVMLI